MDYGRDIEFGFFPSPQAGDYPQVVDQIRIAEESGLDLIGIQDHPYQRRFLDTLSLIADLAARTNRVRFFPDVASLPLRHPPVLAKTAATIDRMSGGRFELGLGAGSFWDAIEGFGGPRRTPGEAVEAIEDAIHVIRLLWSGERNLRYEGRHYRLKGVHSGPVPAHDIAVWVGATGPRMLSLIGRLADGWIPSSGYSSPDKLPEMHERIDQAATAAGRKPADIRRIYNVSGSITDGDRTVVLDGPPSHWVDELSRYALEFGMDTFVFWPRTDPVKQLRRFAEKVAPAVRDAVSTHRSQRPDAGPTSSD